MSLLSSVRAAGLLSLIVSTATLAVELEPLPALALEGLPEEARDQVVEQQRLVTEKLAAPVGDDRALSEAFGELGKVYYLYGFSNAAGACWRNASSLAPGDVRWHYYLGVLGWIEGEHEVAEERLLRALELRPGDLATTTRLADIELERGREEDARRRFRAVLVVDPDRAAALYGLGRIAVAQGRYAEAVPLLERALDGQPEGSVVHHQLGLAYRGLGEIDKATEHLSASRAVAIGFPDPLMEQLVPLVRGAHFQVRVALQALETGALQRAVEGLEKALELDPQSAWIRYNLGVAYRAAGRLADSREQLFAAIALDPDYRDAHFNLATQMADAGEFEAAVRHYRRTAEIDPEDHAARLELAVALSRTGELEEALTTLEALVDEAPTFSPARLARATLLAQMGRPAAAREAAEQALALDASEAERAGAHMLAGRLAESVDPPVAERHYRAAIELASLPRARFRLALLLGRQSRFAEAGEMFTALVEAVPDEPDYRVGLSMALLLGESYPAASAALEAARSRFPESVELTHTLARLLATCPEDGVRDGARALELAQSAMQARQSFDHAETLAMALAEVGRFNEAAALQRQVVEQLRQQGAGQAVARSEQYLKSYEAARPVRAPWLAGGAPG